ncbi:ferredoxin protein [Dioscorea alata]|uniref:Ferredoxin protein n=1 Tax=Dioscorea alata TaxID=55571 RepID=A0ACB7VLP7_DIOAL|nr:ferredoxin protein [Dioscorea alata]
MATSLATFHLFPTTFSSKPSPLPPNLHPLLRLPRRRPPPIHQVASYKVTLEHEGVTRTLEVEEDETILGRVLEEGLNVPHDCKLGVCMTCPARFA